VGGTACVAILDDYVGVQGVRGVESGSLNPRPGRLLSTHASSMARLPPAAQQLSRQEGHPCQDRVCRDERSEVVTDPIPRVCVSALPLPSTWCSYLAA
jgi:hypothetical protein